MPEMRTAADYGMLDPDDLLFLQGIFDEVCARGPADEEVATAVARTLILLFNGGTRGRDPLTLAAQTRRSAAEATQASASDPLTGGQRRDRAVAG
jgi:hypothetical protein